MRIVRDGISDTITFTPDDGEHSATIILIHGLGDSAEGLSDLGSTFTSQFPYCKVILPTASCIPVTLNGGSRMNAWYDIEGLDDRAADSCNGIDESVTKIRNILSSEHSLGLPYSRMVLAGFSQGGAMSLFTGLQLDESQKLAGILVMSGFLPGPSKFNLTSTFESIPILHCHGTADPVVRFEWATKSKQFLTEKGVQKYELKSFKNVGHTITIGI